MTTRNRSMFAVLAAGVFALGSAALARPDSQHDKGRSLYTKCVACHAMNAPARPQTGPHLAGIVGRPAASVEGFNYTQALRAQPFVWTEKRLDAWLKSPHAEFPGMCLPFTGFSRKADRAALIAYLKHSAP